ncbi:MAG: hypothetical protein Q4A90_04310 [Streptococcus sp.]|nr:hypothetical protein [Streptococcus sp.]
MKKLNELNKNSLKLSLICFSNWLLKILLKEQFYLLTAFIFGLQTYYFSREIQQFVIGFLAFLVIIRYIKDFVDIIISKDFRLRRFKLSLNFTFIFEFFLAGHNYIHQYSVTLMNRLWYFWIVSLILLVSTILIQPILFKKYLFKNIINREYLGIRKTTDDLPPEHNLFEDSNEKDADKRMLLINQNVIKQPYQDFVELSFLNKEVITAISFRLNESSKENEQTFVDDDTIYYPVFRVYPFKRKTRFAFKLIDFKISQRDAFIISGTSFIK